MIASGRVSVFVSLSIALITEIILIFLSHVAICLNAQLRGSEREKQVGEGMRSDC